MKHVKLFEQFIDNNPQDYARVTVTGDWSAISNKPQQFIHPAIYNFVYDGTTPILQSELDDIAPEYLKNIGANIDLILSGGQDGLEVYYGTDFIISKSIDPNMIEKKLSNAIKGLNNRDLREEESYEVEAIDDENPGELDPYFVKSIKSGKGFPRKMTFTIK